VHWCVGVCMCYEGDAWTASLCVRADAGCCAGVMRMPAQGVSICPSALGCTYIPMCGALMCIQGSRCVSGGC